MRICVVYISPRLELRANAPAANSDMRPGAARIVAGARRREAQFEAR
jgi:hypothetical protein